MTAQSDTIEAEVLRHLQQSYPETEGWYVIWRGDRAKADRITSTYGRSDRWWNDKAGIDFIIVKNENQTIVPSSATEQEYNRLFNLLIENPQKIYVEVKERNFDVKKGYDTMLNPIQKTNNDLIGFLDYDEFELLDLNRYKTAIKKTFKNNQGVFLSSSKQKSINEVWNKEPNALIYFACKDGNTWYVSKITPEMVNVANKHSISTEGFGSPLAEQGKAGEKSGQVPFYYLTPITTWRLTKLFSSGSIKPKKVVFPLTEMTITEDDIKKGYEECRKKLEERFSKGRDKSIKEAILMRRKQKQEEENAMMGEEDKAGIRYISRSPGHTNNHRNR